MRVYYFWSLFGPEGLISVGFDTVLGILMLCSCTFSNEKGDSYLITFKPLEPLKRVSKEDSNGQERKRFRKTET